MHRTIESIFSTLEAEVVPQHACRSCHETDICLVLVLGNDSKSAVEDKAAPNHGVMVTSQRSDKGQSVANEQKRELSPKDPRAPNKSQSTDPDAYLASFEAHRGQLFSVAYRMLGSRADAEDMLQETFLRWRQANHSNIRDPQAFLVTVITRLCINQLQSARSKREEYFGQWLPEPLLTGPSANPSNMAVIDDSLSMAFLVLLERLSPVQRAVFLLREVFDYEYEEIAGILKLTQSNCRQLLKRAKRNVADDRPRFDASRRQQERLLRQFLETASQGDMQGLIGLLSEDVVLFTDGGGKATAVPNPIYGAEKVARFFTIGGQKLLPTNLVRRFVDINGQPGVVAYHNGTVFGVLTLYVSEGRIKNIYIVRNPDKLTAISNLPAAPC